MFLNGDKTLLVVVTIVTISLCVRSDGGYDYVISFLSRIVIL